MLHECLFCRCVCESVIFSKEVLLIPLKGFPLFLVLFMCHTKQSKMCFAFLFFQLVSLLHDFHINSVIFCVFRFNPKKQISTHKFARSYSIRQFAVFVSAFAIVCMNAMMLLCLQRYLLYCSVFYELIPRGNVCLFALC